MRWIDMDDKEKLFHYSITFKRETNRILEKSGNESYFVKCKNGNAINDSDIMEYYFNNAAEIDDSLRTLWMDADFSDLDMLIKIVSATAMKNMPMKKPMDNGKERYMESKIVQNNGLDPDNSVSPFVYEF